MRALTLLGTVLLLPAFPCAAQLQPARTILLIGPPGSGKTAQAEFLRKRFKIPVLSMAKLLHEEIDRGSARGRLLASSFNTGELLSDESANEVMKARLLRPDTGRGFVLDGYPSTEGQAKELDAWLAEHNLPKPVVIILDVSDAVSRNRLLRRNKADDTRENIERRLRDYNETGLMVEQWYGAQRTARVDGSGTVAEVANRITNAFDTLGNPQDFKTRDGKN